MASPNTKLPNFSHFNDIQIFSISPFKAKVSNNIIPPISSENYQINFNTSPSKTQRSSNFLANQKHRSEIKKRKNSQPIINSTKKQTKSCQNHTQKEAQYKVIMQQGIFFYCVKCSMNLASQGFVVSKIHKHGESPHKRKNLSGNVGEFVIPQFQSNSRSKQIQQFLLSSEELLNFAYINLRKYQDINVHYLNQERIVSQFYQSLISYLLQLKQENISFLKEQNKNTYEARKFQQAELQKISASIQSINSDIQLNIKYILQSISQQKFRECLNFYKQKIKSYKTRVQQQRIGLDRVTNYVQSDCQKTYRQIKSYINSLLGIDNASNSRFLSNMSQQKQKGQSLLSLDMPSESGWKQHKEQNLCGCSPKPGIA